MTMKKITIAIIMAILLISGTASAQNPRATADQDLAHGKWIEMAQRYPVPAVSQDQMVRPDPKMLSEWWESFNDELLTQMVEWAMQSNRDLASAREKVT